MNIDLKTMYPGEPYSPPTRLALSISATATEIEVEDASVLPEAPNIAIIGVDEGAETFLYTLDLTIAGEHFQVNCVFDLMESLQAHQINLAKLVKDISGGTKRIFDAIELCKEITGDILGPFAFERIFAEREPTLTDCSDMLRFVIEEITKFVQKQKPAEV